MNAPNAQKQTTPLRAGELYVFTAETRDAGLRLDIWLANRLEGISRARLQAWLDAGHVLLNNAAARRSQKIKQGDCARVRVPPAPVCALTPEPIPLDIIHEDAEIVVLNKPAGLVAHPAPGHAGGTLVNALLRHCADLSGPDMRPGIVHRLDRDTSGIIVVAKTESALASLAAQFKERLVRKEYLALVWGIPNPPRSRICAAIGRSRSNRKKMAVLTTGGRAAATSFQTLERLGNVALLLLEIETGRTHQIRVHMTHVGHPLVGDPLYGARSCRALPQKPGRQMLHARTLTFKHPATGQTVQFSAPMPEDMLNLLQALRNCSRQ